MPTSGLSRACLDMVRTNTRRRAGVSHTWRSKAISTRATSARRSCSASIRSWSPGQVQAGRLRSPQRDRPADPDRAWHRRRAVRLPECLPPSQRVRRNQALRLEQARFRVPLSRLELRPHRPADRHHRRHGLRPCRQDQARPAPPQGCRQVRADLGGAGGAGGPRGRDLDIDAYLGRLQPDLEGWTMEGWGGTASSRSART